MICYIFFFYVNNSLSLWKQQYLECRNPYGRNPLCFRTWNWNSLSRFFESQLLLSGPSPHGIPFTNKSLSQKQLVIFPFGCPPSLLLERSPRTFFFGWIGAFPSRFALTWISGSWLLGALTQTTVITSRTMRYLKSECILSNRNLPVKLENLIWTDFLIKKLGVETWVYEKRKPA